MSDGVAPVEASRRRQALAGLVDVALVVAPVTWLRVRLRTGRPLERDGARRRAIDLASEALLVALSVARALGRSPGARLTATVTGERASGRPITAVRACALVAVELAPSLVVRALMAPLRNRDRAAMREARVKVRRQWGPLLERHRGDPAALRAALLQLRRDAGMPPLARRMATTLAISWGVRWVLAPLRRSVRGSYVALVRRGGGER